MKTLDQVEARTPVNGSITLTQSGSYYLTWNVTNGGITVSANDVRAGVRSRCQSYYFIILGKGAGKGSA